MNRTPTRNGFELTSFRISFIQFISFGETHMVARIKRIWFVLKVLLLILIELRGTKDDSNVDDASHETRHIGKK